MKKFLCLHEDSLKTMIKFLNKNFFMYWRRFIEDPDKVYKWKPSDVFTKIHWRSPINWLIKNVWMYWQRFIENTVKNYKWKLSDVFTKIHWTSRTSWWIKNLWCIHKDLLKILIKFMTEKFLIYWRRFIDDPDKVYKWKPFDVFTNIYWRPS